MYPEAGHKHRGGYCAGLPVTGRVLVIDFNSSFSNGFSAEEDGKTEPHFSGSHGIAPEFALWAERLLMLVAEEFYAIRFLLTHPERGPMEEEGLRIMERDLEKFRDDLGL
jgi:hypothetical protein